VREALLLGLALGISPGAAACASTGAAGTEAPASMPDPGAVTSADGPFLYVANQEAARVTVIDLSTNRIDRIIDLEAMGYGATAKPHDIAVEPDGSFWYVSLIGADRVLKFDRNGELVASVEFERPGLLALHPTQDWLFVGRSMAAVNPPQRIGRIDRGTMEIEEFDVFVPRPHAIETSPDGGWVYTASLAENSIVSVEAESGEAELLRLPDSGMHPHTIVQFAISPDGSTLVATAEMTAKLLVFSLEDSARPELVHEVDVGARPWHPSYTPDGREVWFGNLGANEVTVVDATSWTVKDVIRSPALAEPHGSAISRDGRYVYISNRNEKGTYAPETDFGFAAPSGNVVVFDAATHEQVEVIETPPYAAGIGLASGPR